MNISTVANLILLKGCPVVGCDILAGCSLAASPLGVRNSLDMDSYCKDLGLAPHFLFTQCFGGSDARPVLPARRLFEACHAQCVLQVQRPQDCFQADTKRPSAPTQHTALVLLCLSSP